MIRIIGTRGSGKTTKLLSLVKEATEKGLDIKFISAHELLKEQKAVKPKSKVRHGTNAQIQHFCGNCNTMLHGKPKFCSECGRMVKWEND